MKMTVTELADLIDLIQNLTHDPKPMGMPEPKPEPEPEVDPREKLAALLGVRPEDLEIAETGMDGIQTAKIKSEPQSKWDVLRNDPDKRLTIGTNEYSWDEIPKGKDGNPSAYWLDYMCPCGSKHSDEAAYEQDTEENKAKYPPKAAEPMSKESEGGYI